MMIKFGEEGERIKEMFEISDSLNTISEKNKLRIALIECLDKEIPEINIKPSTKKDSRRDSKGDRLIDIDDLRLDMPSLDGTTLKVKGVGFYMAGVFMIKRNELDPNPIIVDITRLTRDERRHILGHCVEFMNGCHLTVRGKVRGDRIISDRINW